MDNRVIVCLQGELSTQRIIGGKMDGCGTHAAGSLGESIFDFPDKRVRIFNRQVCSKNQVVPECGCKCFILRFHAAVSSVVLLTGVMPKTDAPLEIKYAVSEPYHQVTLVCLHDLIGANI